MEYYNLINQYQSLDEFRKSIKTLNHFVTDEQWLEMLKSEIALNPVLEKEIISLIKDIDINSSSSEYYNDLIRSIRLKFNFYQKQADEENDIIKKWYKYRHAYAYYGFIEVITEGSIITEKILSKLKEKYKDNYLKILKDIDVKNPSELTNFKKKNEGIVEGNGVIEVYLTMKFWQDEQHIFHDTVLYPKYKKAEERFKKLVYDNCPYLKEIKGYTLLSLYLLDSLPIASIDVLTRFVEAGLQKQLVKVFGGKSIGLAILNKYGCQIPETYAISVGSLQNKLYLEKLKNLKNRTYAVRSSATVEDNEEYSFAGLFVSVLNVSNRDLAEKIQLVYESVSLERVESYVERFKTEKPYMSVVIQVFKEPEYAGVWIGEDAEKGYLEWTKGNGEKLVSGHIKPLFEKYPSEYAIEFNGKKMGEQCVNLQKKINALADLEWCIVDNDVVWLQYRPVTKKIKQEKTKNNQAHNFIGTASSPGKISGKPIFLRNPNEIEGVEENLILLTDYTDPEWVPIILKSKGVITAEGGFLSHTAIICRELGIPCITGVGYDCVDDLKKYKKIQMDGSTGSIKVEE